VNFLSSPNDLDVDQDNVYFADPGDNTIWRVAKNGGSPKLLASNQAGPTFIAIDSDYVYWNNSIGSSIARVAKVGGAVEVIVTTSTAPVTVAVGDSEVYWVANTPNGAGFFSAPKTGGTETLVGVPPNPNFPFQPGMQANSKRLIYPLEYYDGFRLWTPAGLAQRVSLLVLGRKGEMAEGAFIDNGSISDSQYGLPSDITSNSCARYWLSSNGPKRGYPQESGLLVASGVDPRHIAADEQFVYWTEGRTVRKAATADNL
jgi:hypothetical protein